MKQKQFAPLNVAQMGLMVYCANQGHLTDVAVEKVSDFEDALLSYAKSEYADLMNSVAASGDWNDEIEGQFKEAVEKFKATQTF
jgi:F-type H+-transporting ATPase subunit alpha